MNYLFQVFKYIKKACENAGLTVAVMACLAGRQAEAPRKGRLCNKVLHMCGVTEWNRNCATLCLNGTAEYSGQHGAGFFKKSCNFLVL